MPRRKKVVSQLPEGYSESLNATANARHLVPGTEVSIRGRRGRYRFVKFVSSPNSEWIQCWGGPVGKEKMHSFRLEDVKTVHWKGKMR